MKLNKEIKKYWQDNFNKLKAFKKQYEHCNVPENWKGDKDLSKWVSIQRNVWPKLPQEYINKLKKIGFGFEYERDEWEFMYQELIKFKKKFNHISIPSHFKEYSQLSDWLNMQIKKKKYLTEDQFTKLESLEIFKTYRINLQWENNYEKLIKIKKKFGSLVKQGSYKNDRNLSQWLSFQRKKYHSNALAKEQIEKLEALKVDWNPKTNAFVNFYNMLKEYVDEYGCLPTITKHKVLWMRINYYRGKEGKAALSPANYKLLKEIGVFPGPPKKDWMKYFNKLIAYKKKYGITYVRLDHDTKLRSWVQYHRTRKEHLPKEKIKLFNSVNFCWLGESRIRKNYFELNYPQLKDFFEKHGRLPSKKNELVLWSKMRHFRSIKSKLSKEEIKQLKTLGVFETREIKSWKFFFGRLKAYKMKYGTTEVIHKIDPPLYRWVQKNRRMRNMLPVDKKEALDALDFCWITKKKNEASKTFFKQAIMLK